MEMAEGNNRSEHMGIGLGDFDGTIHRFMLMGETSNDRIDFYDNNSKLFGTNYGSLFSVGETRRVGLEVLNGLYTLYVDGEATESSVIQPSGNIIGVVVWDSGGTNVLATAAFDNLTIREYRDQ